MRGSRAKALRRADPTRPNPGRVGGGAGSARVRENAKPTAEGARRAMLRHLMNLRNKPMKGH